MSRPQILVHRIDPEIDVELNQALEGTSGVAPVLHFTDSLRQTISAASDYQPVLFLVDLSESLETVRVLVDEVIAVCPDVTVVGISAFGGAANVDESTLMMSALRLGVEDFVRRPISSIDLGGLFSRRLGSRREKRTSAGTLASFISNKGGVGKSTCAVNVAVELANRHPNRVILIDGSLQMGVCATHLNLEPEASITDAWKQRERLDQQLFQQLTTVHESGLHLMAAPQDAVEAVEIDDAFISRILFLARRTYDFVIVDTFPLFDSTIMAILDLSDLAFIVTDNVVPTLKSVRGYFQLLEDVGFPRERWRLLVNRYSTQSGAPAAGEVERFLGQEIDHLIAADNKIVLAANLGQPLMVAKPRWSRTARKFSEMVDSIEQAREEPAVSPVPRQDVEPQPDRQPLRSPEDLSPSASLSGREEA